MVQMLFYRREASSQSGESRIYLRVFDLDDEHLYNGWLPKAVNGIEGLFFDKSVVRRHGCATASSLLPLRDGRLGNSPVHTVSMQIRRPVP